MLTRLADKSLLRVDRSGEDMRYHLLATVRDYARERLTAAGEYDQARQAHVRFYADFVEQIEPRIGGDARGEVDLEYELNRIEVETPNIRAALDFARSAGDMAGALRITGPLERYAYLRGQYSEVRRWMDSAVTIGPAAPTMLLAKALLGSGGLAHLQCDYATAVRRLEAALRLYQELDDPHGIARALQGLGSVAREQGRYDRSLELHAEALAIAEAAGDDQAVATARSFLGFASWLRGDYERAIAECTVARAGFQALGDVEGIVWSLLSLGAVARFQGQDERAAALLEQSLLRSEGIGFREGVAWALEQLGLLAAGRGDPDADGLLRRSLELHRDAARPVADVQRARRPGRAGPGRRPGRPGDGAAGRGPGAARGDRHRRGALRAGPARRDGVRGAGGARGRRVRGGLAARAAGPSRRPAGRGARARAEHRRTGPRRAEHSQAAATQLPATQPSTAEPPAAESAGSRETLRIRALGAATVHRGDTLVTVADFGYAKPRELLFLLVSSPPLTREQLGAALWPDQSRQQLGNALHTALRGVRRALGDPGCVVYADGRYAVDRSRPLDCDVDTFEQSLAAARRAQPASAALPDLQRAIAAYAGDFLTDMTAGDWALARRDELRRAFEAALLAAGRLHAAAGRHQAAVTAFRRLVAHEPLNETAHRELMSSWAQLGETARAVHHYAELIELLREQVGVPPAAETTALYQRLLGER